MTDKEIYLAIGKATRVITNLIDVNCAACGDCLDCETIPECSGTDAKKALHALREIETEMLKRMHKGMI